MSLFARIKTFIGNLRLRERMLFIYIAGGILPILLLGIYTYQNTRSVLIQKAKESEMDGLNMIADSMSESMSVISDISKQMYFDEKIEHCLLYTSTCNEWSWNFDKLASNGICNFPLRD